MRPGVGLTTSRMWQRWRCMRPIASTRSAHLRPVTSISSWLSESERVGLGAWFEEGDLERALADRVVLAHELVHAALPEHAVPLLVDVLAMRRARGLAVEAHAEGNWFSRSGRQHEMRVASVEPEGDGPASLVEHDVLGSRRPLAGEGPVVQGQALR